MHCLSPKIDVPVPFKNLDNPEPIKVDFGFFMDNVKRVQNLSRVLNSKVLIYPDPVFEKFTEKDAIKSYKSDYLTLNGKNLNRASKESDMKVRIGSKFCNVTSLSLNQLTCKPPEEQPSALTPDGKENYNDLPQVEVIIGNDLVYRIGYLDYSIAGEGQLPKPVMIGVAVGGGV